MDLYSLVGEWRVQAERLAVHRSVGSACFYRAELRPAREQYELALALAPGCMGLQRLLDAVVSLGGGRAERAEGELQHSSLGAADKRLRRGAFETERARGERALSHGFVENARKGFKATLRYAAKAPEKNGPGRRERLRAISVSLCNFFCYGVLYERAGRLTA